MNNPDGDSWKPCAMTKHMLLYRLWVASSRKLTPASHGILDDLDLVPRTPSSSEHSLLQHIKPFIAFAFNFQLCLRDEAAKAGTRRAGLPPPTHPPQHTAQGLTQAGPRWVRVCCDDSTEGLWGDNKSVCTQGRRWSVGHDTELGLVRAQN